MIKNSVTDVHGYNLILAIKAQVVREHLHLQSLKYFNYWETLQNCLDLLFFRPSIQYFIEPTFKGTFVYLVCQQEVVFWLGKTVTDNTCCTAEFNQDSGQFIFPVGDHIKQNIIGGIRNIVRLLGGSTVFVEIDKLDDRITQQLISVIKLERDGPGLHGRLVDSVSRLEKYIDLGY